MRRSTEGYGACTRAVQIDQASREAFLLEPVAVGSNGWHHASARLTWSKEGLEPKPFPLLPSEDDGHRLPLQEVRVDLLLNEQGGRDVSALILQSMLEWHEGYLAVLTARLGTDLPSNPDVVRPPALGGEGQGFAGALACAGLKVDGAAKLWRDMRSYLIHLG
ncbi:hypothetical protein [Streptomyces kronopolitis]|uniref:hypothetical protein n=1 Tax=Streptomyces kronopolitis TaxID=1612435 RepID=UPI003D99E398